MLQYLLALMWVARWVAVLDAAIEAADVVFMRPSLTAIAHILDLFQSDVARSMAKRSICYCCKNPYHGAWPHGLCIHVVGRIW